jgi:hypothetical protein
MPYSAYILQGSVVLLEWEESSKLWKPCKKVLDEFEAGKVQVYLGTDFVITKSTTCEIRWNLIVDRYNISRISGAIGIPLEYVHAWTPTRSSTQLPTHVQNILLQHAERTNQQCPISLERITVHTGTVTKCGHVFTRSAFERWCSTHNTCPDCRCSL